MLFTYRPSSDIVCEAVTSSCNRRLPWVSNMRYLGVHFVQSRTLKCSLDAAKRGFYRAANSIFGKIGRIASEDVVLQLIKSKCVPVLLYGLEACALNKSQMASLDFVVNRFFMKLFNTNNIDTVKSCQEFFSFELPSVELAKRVVKFESKVNTI